MTKRIISFLMFLFGMIIIVNAQDQIFQTMKTELDRNFTILKSETVPAYYIYLRLDEMQSQSCTGRLGRLQEGMSTNSPRHILSSMIRVGSPELDNTHEIRESGYGTYRNMRVEAQTVPVDNNPQALKKAIWLQLDNSYKGNVQALEQVKANMAVKVEQEDKSADFSVEKAEKYYEDPISFENIKADFKEWERKVRTYSAVFNKNKDVVDGIASFYVSLSREYILDTDGREIAQNRLTYNLILAAEALADDGMQLPLSKTWFAYSLDQLPSDEEVLSAAESISNNLTALKKAPVVESFTGPAILSSEAAGVFFHEIFGHRVEGSRLKQETDAQTFKKKIGENVLPEHISVTFDPTLKFYKNFPLNGYYLYDDEGVKAQRVEVVKDGILKNFLMCRTPIEGFSKSNGHGRAQVGAASVSRQSNMMVESSMHYTENELRELLKKEAKQQGKDYAYYFKEVSGGFTTTGRYSPNSFNVTPLLVYRIYTDNRPDELVRGVDLVGTPLAMFSQIEACGKDYNVFNGVCGAESGGVPVSCIAPALFVKRIETQKRAKGQSLPQILPKPESEMSKTSGSLDKNAVIQNAIRKEVDRGLAGLKMDKLQSPFFISYNMSDAKHMSISASEGSILSSEYFPFRSSAARLLIGDYNCTDENFSGTTGGSVGYDGSPCIENDEAGIRYTIWRDLDAIYKNAAETYEQKLSAIKQLNIPQSELELPDWDKTPVVKMNDLAQRNIDFNRSKYEAYAKEASKVFSDYPEIIHSGVNLQIYSATMYFYNTEGSEYKLPISFASLDVSAYTKTEEGENIAANFEFTFADPKELPEIEELKKKSAELAQKLMLKKESPKINESYAGPVLYEGLAVVETFYSNFFAGDISLIAQRKPLNANGYSYGGNSLEEMMDKRVTAREITIEDMTGTSEYNGQKLIGYTPVDAQGVVPPEKLVLVEKGILKTLLNDRVPTPKVPHSNGHALYANGVSSYTSPGVIRMQDTRMKSKQELRAELLERAKEEGYDYAYIVRETMGGGSVPLDIYKVDINTGKEQLLRSAKVNNMNSQVFKKIIAVSDSEMIYNTSAGNLVTVIVPDAILFEELEIQKEMVDNYQKPPIVSLPR